MISLVSCYAVTFLDFVMKYFLIVTLLFAFLVCGCDSAERTVAISGTVTFNGEPLDDAILQIDKNDGSAPVFVKIVDGEFSGQSTLGKKTLRFSALRPAKPIPNDIPGSGLPSHEDIMPPKFSFKSQIVLDVQASGHTDLEYELESDSN